MEVKELELNINKVIITSIVITSFMIIMLYLSENYLKFNKVNDLKKRIELQDGKIEKQKQQIDSLEFELYKYEKIRKIFKKQWQR